VYHIVDGKSESEERRFKQKKLMQKVISAQESIIGKNLELRAKSLSYGQSGHEG
jgi:hypothetical protein